jgi:hypothetical protein
LLIGILISVLLRKFTICLYKRPGIDKNEIRFSWPVGKAKSSTVSDETSNLKGTIKTEEQNNFAMLLLFGMFSSVTCFACEISMQWYLVLMNKS